MKGRSRGRGADRRAGNFLRIMILIMILKTAADGSVRLTRPLNRHETNHSKQTKFSRGGSRPLGPPHSGGVELVGEVYPRRDLAS